MNHKKQRVLSFRPKKARPTSCKRHVQRLSTFAKAQLVTASVLTVCLGTFGLLGCAFAPGHNKSHQAESESTTPAKVETATTQSAAATQSQTQVPTEAPASQTQKSPQQEAAEQAQALLGRMSLTQDFRSSFAHGPKPAEVQKYIVLHDTEGDGDAESVINYWESAGQGVAAHFVINKNGSIVQCVALDQIAHHAGFGDTGHNQAFSVTDKSRDDRVGTTPIGAWAQDYGMNSYSIGIELVHVGGSGDYPAAQLGALDVLIAYLDATYAAAGNTGPAPAGQIIDHKAWRSGNSDTSPEFANYLANYQQTRTHTGRPLLRRTKALK